MIIEPVYVLIASALLVGFVVIRGFQNDKFSKVFLILSLVLTLVAISVTVAYNIIIVGNDLYMKAYEYYKYSIYGILVVSFLVFARNSISKAKEHGLFVNSIKNTQWNAYYVVDRKERIKDISVSLLKELDINRSQVIGERLFNVLNKSLRFTQLNGVETNNKSLELYYNDYKNRVSKGKNEIEELIFFNHKGEQVVLHSSIEPIFFFNRYRGRVLVGEIRTDFDMLSIEKSNNRLKTEMNSLQEKLIGVFETSSEGLFSLDLDERYIWISNSLVEKLGFNGNTSDLNVFRSRIEPTDVEKYLTIISNLTVNNPFYQASYRVNINGNYVWFKEKGKRIFEPGTSATIMGTITPLKTRHFMSSEIDNLDSLKGKEELFLLLTKLINEKKYFNLAIFRLNNIPYINDKYGRGIGNLVLSEYVTNLKESFVTENSDCYRVGGIDFVVPITDPRKADLIRRGSENDKKFLNLQKHYGAMSFELEVLAGIAIFPDDKRDVEDIYDAAKKALISATDEKISDNIIYYEDVK